MSRLVKWLEDYVLPVANRLGQVRWLVALRDAFISDANYNCWLAGSLNQKFNHGS